MKMRKFIVEIQADGRVTCCEYEEPREASKTATAEAWLAGFRQALIHCNDQVEIYESFKGNSLSSNLLYQGAAKVRDVIASYYSEYLNR